MTTTCHCGVTFGGARTEHCLGCHNTFKSTTAGDKHRTGDHAVSVGPNRRRCLTVDEMISKGMVATSNSHGTWVWSTGGGQEAPFWPARQDSAGLSEDPWVVGHPGPVEGLESSIEGVA